MLTIQKLLSLRFVRYLILGVASLILDMGLLILMVEYFKLNYLVSNLFAFLIVNVINYLISRKWVFVPTGVKKRFEFPLFLLLVTIGLGINQFILWLVVENSAADYKIAKVIATMMIVGWNFLTRQYLVFGILSRFVNVKTA